MPKSNDTTTKTKTKPKTKPKSKKEQRHARSLEVRHLPSISVASEKGFEHFDVFFCLNDQVRWATKDNTISLNAFGDDNGKNIATIAGSVGTDDGIHYQEILTAIQRGSLTRLKIPIKSKIEPRISEVTGIREKTGEAENLAHRLLTKEKEETLLDEIKRTENILLLRALIEFESEGRNIVQHRREPVVEAVKTRIDELLEKGGMITYREIGETVSFTYDPDKKKQKLEQISNIGEGAPSLFEGTDFKTFTGRSGNYLNENTPEMGEENRNKAGQEAKE